MDIVHELNRCLKSELASIETYEQALEKHRANYGKEPSFQRLTQIMSDHHDSAEKVRTLIRNHGGTPVESSGAWGTWSQTVMGAAKLFGDKAALKALKEGEESGLKEYKSITEHADAPADVKSALSPLVSRQQEHISELDRMMDAVSASA
jgi:bacterioferritin (cytochrome b1)